MEAFNEEIWPALPYDKFKSTLHLLHMGCQVIGKLKLNTPFEPHWANVALWLTSRGLTTGLIPYRNSFFSIDIDLIAHQVICTSTKGTIQTFDLGPMSVAEFAEKLLSALRTLQIDLPINLNPQEIPHPIPFDQDKAYHQYDRALVNAWWQVLLSSLRVMQRYHAHFDGETPTIGLMWGTFDLRDVRYNGIAVPTTGINAGYIRRNAMNEAQIEVGFWAGNEAYPHAAYFAFAYPQPKDIDQAKIKPEKAHWDKNISMFILNYDDLRKSSHPDEDLFAFFESTYQAESKLAKWDDKFITSGEPV